MIPGKIHEDEEFVRDFLLEARSVLTEVGMEFLSQEDEHRAAIEVAKMLQEQWMWRVDKA